MFIVLQGHNSATRMSTAQVFVVFLHYDDHKLKFINNANPVLYLEPLTMSVLAGRTPGAKVQEISV